MGLARLQARGGQIFHQLIQWLYTAAIWLYAGGIAVAGSFNSKARKRHRGRKEGSLAGEPLSRRPLWFHCASLGEFEQGRPLIEYCRKKYPEIPILLSFFSPSGYETRKNYPGVDRVVYLPADLPKEVDSFLDAWNPRLAVFVKYEVWHNFFRRMHRRGIPLFLVSAIFREKQIYFRPWGSWFRKSLSLVHTIFTQDDESVDRLRAVGITRAVKAGDTRFDRVIAVAEDAKPVPEVERFLNGRRAVVAGSTWPEDEKLIVEYVKRKRPDAPAWVIAPHEMAPGYKKRLRALFGEGTCFFSEKGDEEPGMGEVLVIDAIGLLSTLYRYGAVNFVGGGFGAGIHNTLEPAVYGRPILFGPRYVKFREAKDLVNLGAAKSVGDPQEFQTALDAWLDDDVERKRAGSSAEEYVRANRGATEIIMKAIESRPEMHGVDGE